MSKVNLLDRLPKAKRPLGERAEVTTEDRILSWKLDEEYFDGTRQQGYGGYRYDGRWKPVVERLREQYDLTSASTVLDVGCAKGFLLQDFMEAIPGIEVAGLDISRYAIEQADPVIRPQLHIGNASELPFATDSFDLVISINSLHNILPIRGVEAALSEIERVSRRNKFVSLGAYSTEEEKQALDRWAVVATTYMHEEEWEELFRSVGYSGDYWWFKPAL